MRFTFNEEQEKFIETYGIRFARDNAKGKGIIRRWVLKKHSKNQSR